MLSVVPQLYVPAHIGVQVQVISSRFEIRTVLLIDKLKQTASLATRARTENLFRKTSCFILVFPRKPDENDGPWAQWNTFAHFTQYLRFV